MPEQVVHPPSPAAVDQRRAGIKGDLGVLVVVEDEDEGVGVGRVEVGAVASRRAHALQRVDEAVEVELVSEGPQMRPEDVRGGPLRRGVGQPSALGHELDSVATKINDPKARSPTVVEGVRLAGKAASRLEVGEGRGVPEDVGVGPDSRIAGGFLLRDPKEAGVAGRIGSRKAVVVEAKDPVGVLRADCVRYVVEADRPVAGRAEDDLVLPRMGRGGEDRQGHREVKEAGCYQRRPSSRPFGPREHESPFLPIGLKETLPPSLRRKPQGPKVVVPTIWRIWHVKHPDTSKGAGQCPSIIR